MVMRKELSREFKDVRFDLFLDREKVQRAVDRKSRRVLARTGGFVRTKVRQSMRKRPKKKIITSGPPRWVTRGLKDNIFFFYDEKKRSVVIGPRPFKGTATAVPTTRKSGAALLEFGGGARVKALNRKKPRWVQAKFKPRPFMAPQMPVGQSKLRDNLQKVKFGSETDGART